MVDSKLYFLFFKKLWQLEKKIVNKNWKFTLFHAAVTFILQERNLILSPLYITSF